MKIGIVGELDKNGLTHKTYDAILKVINLRPKNEILQIDLILLKTNDKKLDMLPSDQIYIYDQLTGENEIDKSVKAIEHYYINNKPSLIIVALNSHVDSIIPSVVVKINTGQNNTNMITGFLECDHILYDKNTSNIKVVKPVYGGNVMAHYSIESSVILSFNHSVKSKLKLENKSPIVNYVDYKDHSDNHHINRIEIEYIKDKGLEKSDFVVICGKGVGSKSGVNEIVKWAKSVGAVIGGTKKVIDHGWLPIHQLIGQTGHTISPKICLIIGASGATPFINGIIGSEKIIAINNDKDARIFDYADIGIVEDFRVILAALQLEITELEN